MPKYEIKQEFSGKTASECYQACLRAVPLAGYRIVKRRDIASLVICEGRIQGNRVDLSMIVPMGKPTHVILTVSSESADEDALKVEAERVLEIVGEQVIGWSGEGKTMSQGNGETRKAVAGSIDNAI